MNLKEICYRQIQDNFYYGLFGDYQLVIDKNTGCFNATQLCINSSKNYKDWVILENSKKLIKYYTKKLHNNNHPIFYYIKDSNKTEITGKYLPKELLLDILSWLSVDFYYKYSTIITCQ